MASKYRHDNKSLYRRNSRDYAGLHAAAQGDQLRAMRNDMAEVFPGAWQVL